MKLLIVDEDLHFGRILSSVLGNDGHDVHVVAEHADGMAAVQSRRPEAVIVAVDGQDMRSLAFLMELRDHPHGATVHLAVLAPRLDEGVRGTAEAAGAARVFVRPFSVLDLAAAVRAFAVAPPRSAVAAAPVGRLDLDNTQRILRLWSRRANGDVVLGTGADLVRVTLADGGPLDLKVERAVRAALHGGDLDFQPHDVAGSGDERALGAWIWSEAERAEGGFDERPSRATVISPTRLTESAGRLPLVPAAARVMSALVGPIALGRLCDQQGVEVDEVSATLATLGALGFLSLMVAPNAALPPPSRPAPLPPTRTDQLSSGAYSTSQRGTDPFAATRAPSGGPPPGDPFRSPVSGAGRGPAAGDPFAPLRTTSDAGRTAGPGSSVTQDSRVAGPARQNVAKVLHQHVDEHEVTRPSQPAIPRATEVSRLADSARLQSASGMRAPAPPRSAPVAAPVAPATRPAVAPVAVARPPAGPSHLPTAGGHPGMSRVADPGALIRRLRRELDISRGSDPWTVLSLPQNAEPAMVEQAGVRMRGRYTEIMRAETGEARELAREILSRIEAACEQLAADATPAATDQPGDDAFRAGLAAMAAGDWAVADRRFIVARDQNLDSARNLAHLGWVRVHNPDLPNPDRVADGLDLLLLAEQLDPAYADGQYFLAMVLHRRGDDDAARRRIARALRAEPGHVAANALARKLRRSPGT